MFSGPETDKIAAAVNMAYYNSIGEENYPDVAPHVKHKVLRDLYSGLLLEVYKAASSQGTPRVLDLGSGHGDASLPFLKLGCEVTSVDISMNMLNALQKKSGANGHNIEIVCSDVFEALESMKMQNRRFDVIIACSFLHHVPDYLQLLRDAAAVMSDRGLFFLFQDPLRFDTIGKFTSIYGNLSHYSWRIFQGDVVPGIKRHLRRRRGVDESNPEDNTEYHYFRNGIDHEMVLNLFDELGFNCRIIRYFSTQSGLWQSIGCKMKLTNTFAVIAQANNRDM
ncbi:MAG: class I SAM-dependent methyltransferase [Actinobacteria bacterium]|nr:class I SAM-dependent methyltransferase [Actinomycetota bacterium]